jgi:hypothetical protein
LLKRLLGGTAPGVGVAAGNGYASEQQTAPVTPDYTGGA